MKVNYLLSPLKLSCQPMQLVVQQAVCQRERCSEFIDLICNVARFRVPVIREELNCIEMDSCR